MEIGEIISMGAILVAILFAVVVFIWQAHTQGSRNDALGAELRSAIQALGNRIDVLGNRIDAQGDTLGNRIDALGTELRTEIREQSKTLSARIDAQGDKIDAQGAELRTEIREQGKTLGDKIDAQGGRIHEVELDRARQGAANATQSRATQRSQPADEAAD